MLAIATSGDLLSRSDVCCLLPSFWLYNSDMTIDSFVHILKTGDRLPGKPGKVREFKEG